MVSSPTSKSTGPTVVVLSGIISKCLVKLPNIKSNVIQRIIFGVLLVSLLTFLTYLGPLALIVMTLIIQGVCFSEVISIGYNYNKIPEAGLPHFRFLCWYFMLVANFFFFGETVAVHLQAFTNNFTIIRNIMLYHRFLSFCVYFVGLVLFVLSLVRKYDLRQFKILAWTHTLLIIIVLQSYMAIANIFQGQIWLILPLMIVVLNDIFAYIFGRLMGRTPLIELSPNKTWEGFIGGGIGTFISGFILTNLMCKFQYFICPLKYEEVNGRVALNTSCTPGYLFEPHPVHLLGYLYINVYPFTKHFLAISGFASIIAPFGGFCASGFKRAFNIKDFGDAIPGHGGIMDRFDCQFLMATFINVYIFTFVRNPSVDLIYQKALYLDDSSQLQFFGMLRDLILTRSGVVLGSNSTVQL